MSTPSKRKRSASAERERERERERDHRPSLPYPGSHSDAPASPSAALRGLNGAAEAEPSSRETYSPTHAYPPPQQDLYHQQPSADAYAHSGTGTGTQLPPPHTPQSLPGSGGHVYPPPPGDPRDPHGHQYPRPPNGYEPPLDPSIAPQSQERPYYSESHLADVLQRENRSYDAMPSRESYGATDEEDQQQYGGTYGGTRDRDSQSMTEADRKRRKRVFSNRTKTGCMTCRRRKKKCDEGQPECNNCLRGGFVCEGYNIRGPWQKPANVKAPVPLQSKNGYPQEGTPTRGAPYPPMGRYGEGSPGYSSPSQSSAQGMKHSQLEDKNESPKLEDDGNYGDGRMPSPPLPAVPQPGRRDSSGRSYPSGPSKYPQHEHRGSIGEMTGDAAEEPAMPPQPAETPAELIDSALTRATIPTARPASPPTPLSHEVQAAAQAALTHPAVAGRPSTRSRSEQYTEREKMLKGLYYYPSASALSDDRERCIAALWRFNNATNPANAVNAEDRMRLFREILALRPAPEAPLSLGDSSSSPGPPSTLPFGSCGEGVVVDAPFHCDYGYNITIGDDVLIGPDCRISDTCSVTIGARCIFSPNVKLVCATYPIDPRRRRGSRGTALGRNIVIEEDCWIGANVTILAGVRVGQSSTVGAGSLLHQDVPRFTVVAGNPAKVSRGIYEGSGEAPQ